MGEGKRKLEVIRVQFLAHLDDWSFPATDWEVRTVEEIKLLPVVKVPRASDGDLAYLRMRPNHCHANVRAMVKNDPEQRSEQITGWWLQENGDYVLHSILNQWGQLACVTPPLGHGMGECVGNPCWTTTITLQGLCVMWAGGSA